MHLGDEIPLAQRDNLLRLAPDRDGAITLEDVNAEDVDATVARRPYFSVNNKN